MNLLVSIIVPVYNVDKYLKRCVDSILNQTYINLEIILVNDGSTDNSASICDWYKDYDSRVIVVHKKNGGLSDARNAGVSIATGHYLSFIDSDDYVHERFIEVLLDNATKSGADISVCGYKKVYEHTPNQTKTPLPVDVDVELFESIDAMRDIFSPRTRMAVTTWNKLYKRNIFFDFDIKFPIGKLHEDNFTTYKLFHKAYTVVFQNINLLYYFQRSDSIMGRRFGKDRLDLIEAVDQTLVYVVDENIPVLSEAAYYAVFNRIGLYNEVIVTDSDSKESVKSLIRNGIIDITEKYALPHNVTLYHRLAIFFIKKVPGVYPLVVKIKKIIK